MGTVQEMEQVGGHPVVDFPNTLGGLPEDPDEYLNGYADLVAFAEVAELVPAPTAARLLRAARRRRTEAADALAAALSLRGSIDAVLRAHLDGRRPAGADLEALRRAHVAALREAELARTGGRYDWSWPSDELERPVHALAVSAVELLRDGSLDRLRRCGHCRRLFLDTSRNRTRRWCSMTGCGSVVKMRRYRASRRGS